jgi:uncharacterized membrane protein
MAEKQSRHRQDIERRVIFTRSRNETLGQVFAFILSFVVVTGSVWLISIGKSTEGLTAILANLVTLAGIFIYGKVRQKRELDEKRQKLTEAEQ